MYEQVVQLLSSCAFDQLSNQQASQAAVSVFSSDVDALDMSRQPSPDLRSRDPFNFGEPSHPDGGSAHLDEIRNMGVLVFGDPSCKLGSESLRIALFGPLYRPPGPPQPSEFFSVAGAAPPSRGAMRSRVHIRSFLHFPRSDGETDNRSPVSPCRRTGQSHQPESEAEKSMDAAIEGQLREPRTLKYA
jgi:hypothetical protein